MTRFWPPGARLSTLPDPTQAHANALRAPPPAETQAYVEKVMRLYGQYRPPAR